MVHIYKDAPRLHYSRLAIWDSFAGHRRNASLVPGTFVPQDISSDLKFRSQ
jgi:hypothetical protein